MTIHGKGPVRNMRSKATAARNWLVRFRCKMPEDIKKAWPDAPVLHPHPGPIHHGGIYDGKPCMAVKAYEILKFLRVKRTARILDIGAGYNEVIKGLWAFGYLNGLGIDVGGGNETMPLNFRDLPLKEKFSIIHFSLILDQFRTRDQRYTSHFNQPLELFAEKIWHHLRFSGYLLYSEPNPSGTLQRILPELGFVRIELPEALRKSAHFAYAVWQKKPLP